ncbi:Rid family detoxifying hydrolase [Winogradskyella sp. R77965]|uniref:Rid family detoxifying hydrolase n=1 Tax=Winogradskyella sp. R77965 TaxID=3093872 RepID=UPI0037DCCFDF
MKSVFSILSLFILMSFQSCENSNSEIIFHKSHEPSRADVPFSDAVETDDLLFLTGQIGKNHKTGKLVTGGINAETKQVIKNIKDVLEYHNLSLDDIVKCTVILKDIDDFKDFNWVYTTYFPKKPARTTFAASGLAGGASIEIDVIAAK